MESHNKNNVYAMAAENAIIHISEAISGRNGYYCLGCKAIMQAVKFKIPNHISYFRHDPTDVNYKGKCTFSDEEYRRKIAIETLQRLKRLKTPTIYKPDSLGTYFKVADARFINADEIMVNQYFYEDPDGLIVRASGKLDGTNQLLVKADFVFFDPSGVPILLIVFVNSFKSSVEQNKRLKRLGIDSVQFKIPTDSPSEIERAFSITEYTKWIYSNEYERASSVPISNGTSESIQYFDEIQGGLFEETLACRQSEIRNIIRALTKCLGSKQHTEFEERLREEIFRTETSIAGQRRRFDELRSEAAVGVERESEPRRRKIKYQEEELLRRERQLDFLHPILEKRYRRINEEIGRAQKEFGKQIESRYRELGIGARYLDERRRRIEAENRTIGARIEKERATNARLEFELSNIPVSFEQKEARYRDEVTRLEDFERSEVARIERASEHAPAEYREARERIERKFKELRDRVLDQIENRIGGRDTDLSRRIKELLSNGGLLKDCIEKQVAYNRNRKAWDSFKEGAYKSWT